MATLTADARTRLRRLRDDRLCYFAKALKIRDKDGRLVPFRVNPIQQRIDATINAQRAAGKPARIITLKARQEGVSTYTQGYIFHDAATKPLRNALTVNFDDASTVEMFAKCTMFYENLPVVLRPMKRYSSRSGELVFDNPKDAERETSPGLRSQIHVATAGNKNAGASTTLSTLHCTELARWTNAKDTLLSLEGALADGIDTFEMIESTAQGAGGEFHSRYNSAKRGESDFVALFFAWFDNPEYAIPGTPAEDAALLADLDDEEKQLVAKHAVSLTQLRWRRWCIRNKCGNDVERFHQDYPANDVEAFIVSGKCFFDKERLRLAYDACEPGIKGDVDADGFHATADGYLEVWEPPEKGEAYVIGGDVAEGLEKGDYSCYEVLRRSDLAQVAEWHGHMDPDAFGKIGVELAKWYHGAWLGIEANNHGISANKAAASEGYANLYHQQTGHDQDEENPPTRRLGWLTSPKTRRPMLDELNAAIRDEQIGLRSEQLVSECTTFIRTSSGKPEAANDAHDDTVFATAIALQLHQLCPTPRTTPVKRYVRPVASTRTGW